jgi:hypothetical protein
MMPLSIDHRNGIWMFAFAVANTNLLGDDEAEPAEPDASSREPPLLTALLAAVLTEDPEARLLERLRVIVLDAHPLPMLRPDAPGGMGVVVAFAEERLEGTRCRFGSCTVAAALRWRWSLRSGPMFSTSMLMGAR